MESGRVVRWVRAGMLPGVLLLAATLVSVACEGEGEGDGENDDGGACGGGETDFCRVRARYSVMCTETPNSEAESYESCRTMRGDSNERIADCYVAAYGACLLDGCGDEDRCAAEALITYDSTQIDAVLFRMCRDATEPKPTECDDVTRGVLQECGQRAVECDAWDDLCLVTVILAEPYRSQARECLAVSCDEFEGCLRDATGTPRD